MFYPKSPCCPDSMCGDDSREKQETVCKDSSSASELLTQIHQLGFAVYDLQLYLDTHPYDEQALELFTKLSATLASVKMDYEMNFGPLKACSSKNETPFAWVADDYDWPWAKKGER